MNTYAKVLLFTLFLAVIVISIITCCQAYRAYTIASDPSKLEDTDAPFFFNVFILNLIVGILCFMVVILMVSYQVFYYRSGSIGKSSVGKF